MYVCIQILKTEVQIPSSGNYITPLTLRYFRKKLSPVVFCSSLNIYLHVSNACLFLVVWERNRLFSESPYHSPYFTNSKWLEWVLLKACCGFNYSVSPNNHSASFRPLPFSDKLSDEDEAVEFYDDLYCPACDKSLKTEKA